MMVRSILCGALVLGLASVASAEIVFDVNLQYVQSYDSAWNSVPMLTDTQTVLGNSTTKHTVTVDGGAAIHEFKMLLSVSGLASDEDVVGMQYKGVRSGDVVYDPDASYSQSVLSTTSVDPSGPAGLAVPWYQNFLTTATDTFVHDMLRGGSTTTYGDYASTVHAGETALYDIGTLTLQSTGSGSNDTFGFAFQTNPGYFVKITGNTGGVATGVSFEVGDDEALAYTGKGDSIQFVGVPEPSTLALLATGLFGLIAYAWRKRK